MNIGTIKQFSAEELRQTIGELPEQDFQFGGRIHAILDSKMLAEDSVNYNDNLLDWIEKTLD